MSNINGVMVLVLNPIIACRCIVKPNVDTPSVPVLSDVCATIIIVSNECIVYI